MCIHYCLLRFVLFCCRLLYITFIVLLVLVNRLSFVFGNRHVQDCNWWNWLSSDFPLANRLIGFWPISNSETRKLIAEKKERDYKQSTVLWSVFFFRQNLNTLQGIVQSEREALLKAELSKRKNLMLKNCVSIHFTLRCVDFMTKLTYYGYYGYYG